MKTLTPRKALRHVYHSVYLQILLGGVMAILIPAVTQRTEILGADARHTGGMMIFMGLNVYCYLRRYEKTRTSSTSGEPNVA